MTFRSDPFRFSGPGQGILDRGESGQTILPVTDGDAVITVTEERFDAARDKTGSTKRNAYRLGQNLSLTYPMKTAAMSAYALAARGNQVLRLSYPLLRLDGDLFPWEHHHQIQSPTIDDLKLVSVAGETDVVDDIALLGEKDSFAFDFFRTIEPLFDATGAPVGRTVDCDPFGLRLDHCVMSPNGPLFQFHKGESTYSIRIEAILPSKTDTLYRFFNTDLALA